MEFNAQTFYNRPGDGHLFGLTQAFEDAGFLSLRSSQLVLNLQDWIPSSLEWIG